MKTAAHTFDSTQSESTEESTDTKWESVRYALVAIIIVTIGLLASMMPEDASALAFKIGPGFLFFWFAGACTTLLLLTHAARKPV